MHAFAPPVRTHVEPPVSFHDLMSEQLRHAPWFLLSALAHAVVLLLVWLLLPPEQARAVAKSATVTLPEDVVPVAPPVPVEPPPTVDPVETEPTLQPVEMAPATADASPDQSPALDAFPSDPGSNVVGLLPVSRPGTGGRPGRHGPGRGGPPGGAPLPNIERGLRWLAKHQDEDGRWDCDAFMKHDTTGEPCDGAGNPVHDVGVTGLALLAFLGDGNTLRQGAYRDQVRAGVRWLREQQHENGRFGPAAASDFVYDHAIAAYAMCEAYGLSAYTTLRPVAQRGLDYLAAHRNPYGAWRYQPRDGDSDTSVTGWCILALCSGEHFGLVVDRNGLRIAEQFLESCTGPDGHVGYQRLGEASARKPGDHATRFPAERTESLTAVGLFCRFFRGQDPKEEPRMKAAAERLAKRPPKWDPKGGTIDHYYWYYATYAMFQYGGQPWRDWSKALTAAVVNTQRTDANADGSWDPIDVWGDDGGRVYSTAILVLTLQAYYRYGRLVPGNR